MVDATQVQIRRGTQGQIDGFVPVEGEIICNLTEDTLHVGDGTRPGGFMMPNGFHIQNQYFTYAEDTGIVNALVADLPLAPLTLERGIGVKIRVLNTNTGASTLNLNGLGVYQIRKLRGGLLVPLEAGDLTSGVAYDLTWDGTYFVMSTSGGLPAPVAGSTYTIYRATAPGDVRSTTSSSTNWPDYYGNNSTSFTMRVLLEGSVQVRFEQRVNNAIAVSGAGVRRNGLFLNTWSTGSTSFQQRSINVSVEIGDVISVVHRRSSGLDTLRSEVRNVLICSDTLVGAISG